MEKGWFFVFRIWIMELLCYDLGECGTKVIPIRNEAILSRERLDCSEKLQELRMFDIFSARVHMKVPLQKPMNFLNISK